MEKTLEDVECTLFTLDAQEGEEYIWEKKLKKKSPSRDIPDGEYTLNRNIKGFGRVNGKAIVKKGVFTLLKGSFCGNTGTGYVHSLRKSAKIKDNILQEDIDCFSPSSAGWVIIGKSNNGWMEWKDSDGNSIEKYRSKEDND